MVRSFHLDIRPDPQAQIARGIELFQDWSKKAIAERGFFSVALSGGSTPKAFYSALAEADMPWDKLYIFWGDERYVPHDHPDSNYRMTRETLLDRVPIPSDRVFPFPTSAGDPAIDAAAYAETLKQVFEGEWPDFDCNLLGVGGDGHTASLFPSTDALKADGWTTVGNKSGEPRLTLTIPAIEHSRRVMFWVNGAGKSSIIKTLLIDQVGLPAQQIKPEGELIWMLDTAAAAELPLVAIG